MGPATVALGDPAPNFVAQTTEGELDFHRWKGRSWAVLFCHPADFTPVCTTELGEVARLKGEFDRRGAKLIGLSIDSVADHVRWLAEIEETQRVRPDYPLIGDSTGSVAARYGMVGAGAEPEQSVRALFVIDPANTVRATSAYPPSVGRSFVEVLRLLDALQVADAHGVNTPAAWRPGERVIVSPATDDETAIERFGAFEAQRPYLRWVDQPTEEEAR